MPSWKLDEEGEVEVRAAMRGMVAWRVAAGL
jgi:hypothetical protein